MFVFLTTMLNALYMNQKEVCLLLKYYTTKLLNFALRQTILHSYFIKN